MGKTALYCNADKLRGVSGSKRSSRPILQTEDEMGQDKEKKRCARAERAQKLKTI